MSKSKVASKGSDAKKTRVILTVIIAAIILTFIGGRIWLKYAANNVRDEVSEQSKSNNQ